MTENAVFVHRPLSDSVPRDTVATINPRWLPGLRALWLFVAVNSAFGIAWTFYLTRQFSDTLPARLTEGLRELGWTNDTYFWFNAIVIAVIFSGYALVGVLIFLLRPRERLAWLASIFLISFGTQSIFPTALEYAAMFATAPLLYRISYFVNNLFSFSVFFLFFALFPDGRLVPRWMRYVVAYTFIFCAVWGAFPDLFGGAQGLFGVWVYGSAVVMFGAGLYAQIWRYRNYATPLQKQQAKWLVFGLGFILLVLMLPGLAYYAIMGQFSAAQGVAFELLFMVLYLGFLSLPLAVGFSILRYRLWDIDLLIRRTVTYALVTALLVVVFFASVVVLQQVFALLTDTRQNDIATVLSTLTIAALFVPLRNRIQEFVDRRFYRKKYDAQQVLQNFAETVRDETDLEHLTGRLMEVVHETMQPKSMSVWLKSDEKSEHA